MIVLGAGRVGRALAAAAADNGEPCRLIGRGDPSGPLDDPPGAPILLAVGADHLDGAMQRIPEWRRNDLVFVQNGAIGPWLESQRLAEVTRAILYFAAAGGDVLPTTGPFPTVVHGPHAMSVVRWLVRCGVPAHAVEWPRFLAAEAEKLVWTSAFGALCDRWDCDLQAACSDEHRQELSEIVQELRRVIRATHNVDIEFDWLLDRLVRYSLNIPKWRPRVKEWSWRNGWFVAEALRIGAPTPAHATCLWAAGHRGGGVEHLLPASG